MNVNTRANVAYVAARAIINKNASSVYVYGHGHISMSGSVTGSSVNVFNYAASAYVTGRRSGRAYKLYDYGQSAHVSLTVRGQKFEGYNYGTSCHFSGRVQPNGSVSLYDYGAGSYFNFSI